MLRTLDRYLLREVTLAWLAVTGVLLVILVTHQLATALDRAADNHLSREVVFMLIGLGTLQYLTILVPMGLLLGVVLAFGRLYHDSEMAAVHACGVGLGRLYIPVMLLTAVLTGVLAWLSLDLAPSAGGRVQQLRILAVRDAQFGDLQPGRFRSIGSGGGVFYAAGADPDGTLRQVFVKRSTGGRLEVAVAERARHYVSEGGRLHTFVLEHGRQYLGVPGSREFRIVEFAEHGIPVRIEDASLDTTQLQLKSTAALLGSSKPDERAELQWRFSMPVMAVVLSLLAVPLSRLRPRQGRYARVGFAILLYFIYMYLLQVAKVWMEREVVPSWLGLWWVHVLLVTLALAVLFRTRLWPRRPAKP